MSRSHDILSSIGNTALVELTRVVPANHARVLVKLESNNPTGSMKDRMALSVVDRALASGRLRSDGRLVEYTGGSTGTSLAFVCASRGVAITIVTSDAFSIEKRNHMRALGATVIEMPSDQGKITRELIQGMIAKAKQICETPGNFFADQFHNTDAIDGYVPLADEIWEQSGHRVDAFVQAVGTANCITGVARRLRSHHAGVRIVAVEPAESPVLSGGLAGAHRIEGIGPGFVAPHWHPELANALETVTSADAMAMARRLAAEEALFAGTSTGANVVAAIREASRLGAGKTVVTLACDSGLKYVSTELYAAR